MHGTQMLNKLSGPFVTCTSQNESLDFYTHSNAEF